MTQELVQCSPAGTLGADDRTPWRFVNFFAVTIRNPNTREAYFRALIGAVLFTLGQDGAVIAMNVEDYRISNHQRMFLLHEKGGKMHQVPAHHRIVEHLGEFMYATGLGDTPREPLFQAVDITKSRLKGTRIK